MCAWRYFGRARVDKRAPRAAGYCDRCGFLFQLSALKWQFQWRGSGLANTGFRVCDTCMDVPAAFLKAIAIPADPVPVRDPRPGDVNAQMANAADVEMWDVPFAQWDDAQSVWL